MGHDEESAEDAPGATARPGALEQEGEGWSVPGPLATGLAAWSRRGDAGPLVRWLDRELGDSGVPRRLPVAAWGPCLSALAEARGRESARWPWPAAADARIAGLVTAAVRFARADGSKVFGPEVPAPRQIDLLRDWAGRLADPTLTALVRGAFSRSSDRGGDLPFRPTCVGGPLAVLGAGGSAREGDRLAIDHREPARPCLLELVGRGVRWLGPTWGAEPDPGPTVPPRVTGWHDGIEAELAEWTFRAPGGSRVERTALLLPGRHLALLADQVEDQEPSARLRLAVPLGIEPVPLPESRALILTAGRSRSARVLPLALPAPAGPTEAGSLTGAGGEILLQQPKGARRAWLPLLISWRAARHRRSVHWRTLTVSERSRVCPPGVAFAARVAWGTDESLVVYRSLARPALRAFLGYQTSARFLVGLFTREGTVRPLLKVEA